MTPCYGKPYPKESYSYTLCYTFKGMYSTLHFPFLPSLHCHLAWLFNMNFKNRRILSMWCIRHKILSRGFVTSQVKPPPFSHIFLPCKSVEAAEGTNSVRVSGLSGKIWVGQSNLLKSGRDHTNLARYSRKSHLSLCHIKPQHLLICNRVFSLFQFSMQGM